MQIELNSIVARTEALESALYAVEWIILGVEDDDERHTLADLFARSARSLAEALLTDKLVPFPDGEPEPEPEPPGVADRPVLFPLVAAGGSYARPEGA